MPTELCNIKYTVNGVEKVAVGEVVQWARGVLRFINHSTGRIITVAARNVRSVKPLDRRVAMA